MEKVEGERMEKVEKATARILEEFRHQERILARTPRDSALYLRELGVTIGLMEALSILVGYEIVGEEILPDGIRPGPSSQVQGREHRFSTPRRGEVRQKSGLTLREEMREH